jgi:hypothetical protein
MSRTIETIIPHTGPARRGAKPTDAKRLTAKWQNGLESGGHVQCKLRLGFSSVLTHQSAN